MITREFGGGGYKAGCAGSPPPLHVTPDSAQASWFPLPRIILRPQPPGPVMIKIPVVAPFGDDPLDPAAQTEPRIGTAGMIGYLNARPGPAGVRGEGRRS